MPGAATTADVFNAIAQPWREIIDLLVDGREQAAGEQRRPTTLIPAERKGTEAHA
jgi:hypothetical protein